VSINLTRSSTKRHRFTQSVALATLILLADQFAKLLIIEKLGPEATTHRVELLGNFVALEYAENRGMAFGLLQGQTALVTVLACVVVVLALRAFRQIVVIPVEIAIGGGLIAGGAIGNLLDRARLGYVVDFVAVASWPNFNVADSAITIGALLIAWRYLRDDRSVSQPNRIRTNLA
jgi:signal peptidase II